MKTEISLSNIVNTQSKVINIIVDDNRATNDGIWAIQSQTRITKIKLSSSFIVRYDITQVANMSFVITWRTVSFASRIEVNSCTRTPITQIAELIHTERM